MNALANDLSTNVLAFCGVLRNEHGFAVGHSEAKDALRAVEIVGVADRATVRSALRLVCCGTHGQTLAFDRAFDEFFISSRSGLAQPALVPRQSRPGPEKTGTTRSGRRNEPNAPAADSDAEDGAAAPTSQLTEDDSGDGSAWHLLRARYSQQAASGDTLDLDPNRAANLRWTAQRLIRSVSRGRSRRWKAMNRSGRFDMRRTIRASLETAGDPVALHFLGHPLRNPRFIILIDGSRSMAEHTGGIVEFAAALCERSARAKAFFFSTKLLEVTSKLHAACRAGATFSDLGEAWGGGTKIGESLASFVTEHGNRVLSPETVVIVFSDGLDVGTVSQLTGALREIDRRSAGIVWLNPYAASPGFVPSARGMRAALPFITLLCAANDERGFETLAKRIAQTPRFRGRR